MSVTLYDRRSTVIIQPARFTGTGSRKALAQPWASVPAYAGFNPMSPLRTKFSIEKTIQPEPNRAKIEIYNLNPTNRNLPKKNDLVTLRAGYAGDAETSGELPIIFRGNISRAFDVYTGTDWVTTLETGDGKTAFKEGKINDMLPTGAGIEQAVEKMKERLETLGVEVMGEFSQSILAWITDQFQGAASSPNADGTSTGGASILQAPKALVGKVSDLLTQETDKLGLSWSVQNNVLVVRPKGGNDGQPPILLNSNTGLLGFPSKTEKGMQGQALLIPGVAPGRKITVESRTIEGDYIVTKATFEGDTHSDTWFVNFEAHAEGTTLPVAGA